MRIYLLAGYATLAFYALACICLAPPHIGPWAGLSIGAAYFFVVWFVAGVYLSLVIHLGIAHRSLDYKEWFIKTIGGTVARSAARAASGAGSER